MKKNKNPIYTVSEKFEIEHLVEYAMETIEDGTPIEDAIRDVILSAKSDEWFETRFNMMDCVSSELDLKKNKVTWYLQKGYNK